MVAFKIDLEKVYDKICWDFLRVTVKDFRFPMSMINFIMKYVSSSKLSILWNGGKTEEFKPTRGLRQGDPLSLYLFVFCMEKLRLLIQDKV